MLALHVRPCIHHFAEHLTRKNASFTRWTSHLFDWTEGHRCEDSNDFKHKLCVFLVKSLIIHFYMDHRWISACNEDIVAAYRQRVSPEGAQRQRAVLRHKSHPDPLLQQWTCQVSGDFHLLPMNIRVYTNCAHSLLIPQVFVESVFELNKFLIDEKYGR